MGNINTKNTNPEDEKKPLLNNTENSDNESIDIPTMVVDSTFQPDIPQLNTILLREIQIHSNSKKLSYAVILPATTSRDQAREGRLKYSTLKNVLINFLQNKAIFIHRSKPMGKEDADSKIEYGDYSNHDQKILIPFLTNSKHYVSIHLTIPKSGSKIKYHIVNPTGKINPDGENADIFRYVSQILQKVCLKVFPKKRMEVIIDFKPDEDCIPQQDVDNDNTYNVGCCFYVLRNILEYAKTGRYNIKRGMSDNEFRREFECFDEQSIPEIYNKTVDSRIITYPPTNALGQDKRKSSDTQNTIEMIELSKNSSTAILHPDSNTDNTTPSNSLHPSQDNTYPLSAQEQAKNITWYIETSKFRKDSPYTNKKAHQQLEKLCETSKKKLELSVILSKSKTSLEAEKTAINSKLERDGISEEEFETPNKYSGIGAELELPADQNDGSCVFKIRRVFLDSPAKLVGLEEGYTVTVKNIKNFAEALMKIRNKGITPDNNIEVRDKDGNIKRTNTSTAIFKKGDNNEYSLDDFGISHIMQRVQTI